MKKFMNAIIILFSLYSVFLIIRGEQSLFFYLMLFLIEWVVIMICNPMLRKVTFSKLYHSKLIGDENAIYGSLNYNNVEEVIAGLSQTEFKELVKDILQMKGYDIDEESKFEDTILVTLGDKKYTVKIKAKSEDIWEVQPEFIEEAIKTFHIGDIMIITNGRFNKESIKKAKEAKVTLINEARFITWTREVLYNAERENNIKSGRKNHLFPRKG